MSTSPTQAGKLRALAHLLEGFGYEIHAREVRDGADEIDALTDRLASKTCMRVYHPNRTRVSGPQYTCSVCGYGASDDRWRYCPKCGSEYGNTRADARDETGYE